MEVSINGGTPKWMVYSGKAFILKWMIWGQSMIPNPSKCMERVGGGKEFFIHFHPLSETGIIVLTFLGNKLKRLPKEVGGAPHIFSVFGFKSLFRKR